MTTHSVLGKETRITLPERTEPFDPAKFYQTRKGLFIWSEFETLILPAAHPVDHLPALEIASYDLIKNANDADIQQELSKGHEFKTSVFLPHLAGMIERQNDGRPGDLLTNGDVNIAYVWGMSVGLVAVRVYWIAVGRRWSVGADGLSDFRWNVGRQVLSRTCRPAT